MTTDNTNAPGRNPRLEQSAPPTYVVACLAGHGIGPEVMAEASRALGRVSRLHGFRIEELHVPFGNEAVVRAGHPLPAATRSATAAADAVLVAGRLEAALETVGPDLDLAAAVRRILLEGGRRLTLLAPLRNDDADWTIERGFDSARSTRCSLVAVGVDTAWRERVDRVAEENEGITVRHLPLADALEALADEPGTLDVVITERSLADALAGAAPGLSGKSRHLAASGRLSRSGPGLFGPTHGPAHDIAGQGVANPTEMLIASALLLGEGLGRRAASETLEESLVEALLDGVRTPDLNVVGPGATTREFADLVLVLLPGARRDTEFALGGTA